MSAQTVQEYVREAEPLGEFPPTETVRNETSGGRLAKPNLFCSFNQENMRQTRLWGVRRDNRLPSPSERRLALLPLDAVR